MVPFFFPPGVETGSSGSTSATSNSIVPAPQLLKDILRALSAQSGAKVVALFLFFFFFNDTSFITAGITSSGKFYQRVDFFPRTFAPVCLAGLRSAGSPASSD